MCKRKDTDPGIRITQILTEGDGRKDLVNDTLVPVARLNKGITIVCDGVIVPASVGPSPLPVSRFPDGVPAKPTCFVTLDLPYPIGRDQELWDSNRILGFQPLILAANVTAANQEIRWVPTTNTSSWLQGTLLPVLASRQIADRVLAHLTLKGNYIWSLDAKRTEIYLDAEGFGTLSKQDRIDLRLPTGDRRKGGDFEMWFWLFQPTDTGVVLTAVGGIFTINGSVQDVAGAVIPGVQVTATHVATGKQQTVTTSSDGKFVFVQLAVGPYQVRVQVGGVVTEKTAVVIGPPIG